MKNLKYIKARLKCLLGKHDWNGDCNGWTGDEWVVCMVCGKIIGGSLYLWDTKMGILKRPTKDEAEKSYFPRSAGE